MSYTCSSHFHEAASYIANASSVKNVSSSIKLELYGLFKYLTVSVTPTTSRPSIFDMTGRAKWDAWNSASKAYVNAEDAETRYLDLARSLGWTEGVTATPEPNEEEDDEDIWDDDSTSQRHAGEGTGMTVSAMAQPDEEPDGSIHGLTVANDTSALSLHLQENPDVDINKLDDFGYTPLHLASDRGHLAAVQLLVSSGADRTIKDPDDLTASELARIAGHHEIAAILESS